MGKKKGARPRVFNDDLDPVRADQIDLVWEDNTYQEREDKPLVLKRLDTPSSSSGRNVKGEGLRLGRRRTTGMLGRLFVAMGSGRTDRRRHPCRVRKPPDGWAA